MIQAGWNILLGEVATSWASWFLFPFLVFSGVRIYDIYAPDLIGLQVIRDGIPQLVISSIVPLRTCTAVHVFSFFFHLDTCLVFYV